MKKLNWIILILTIIFISSCDKEDISKMIQEDEPVIDIDENTYKTVKIGEQIWMAENLRVTRFNDGTEIPQLIDVDDWKNSNLMGYCWYNNDKTYSDSYGAIYNGRTIKSDKLCPTGWHIPTLEEWQTLIDYAGGDSIAGLSLKEQGNEHWTTFNKNVNNKYGFTALPGGYRDIYGEFKGINHLGIWWTSTNEDSTPLLWFISISRYFENVDKASFGQVSDGYSVRCVKD